VEILAFLGSIKYILIVIGAGLLALWGWIQGKRIKEQGRTIQEQENSIMVHESKDKIDTNDDVIDQKLEQEKTELEEKMEGKPDEEVAKIIENTLDSFFGTKSKSE